MANTQQQDINAVINDLKKIPPAALAQIDKQVSAEDMGKNFFTGNPQKIFGAIDAASGLNLAKRPYANMLSSDLQNARINNTTSPQVQQGLGLKFGKSGFDHLLATLTAPGF